jgi:prepilin-type N-terminal cleavage/methylation domain-containing protein
MNTKGRKREQGFTLIEIIAVLVILGILAAVAVPKFFDMQKSAEKKTLQIAFNDMKSRAVTCISSSMLENNGAANSTDCITWSELGFNSTDAVENAYKDFAGSWTRTSDTVITYNGKNIDTATYTIAESTDTDDPLPEITEAITE